MHTTYIRFTAKYLDGEWRKETVNMGSHSENRKYAKELVEMFKHFLYKGNILGYTVEIVTAYENDKHIEVIGKEEM